MIVVLKVVQIPLSSIEMKQLKPGINIQVEVSCLVHFILECQSKYSSYSAITLKAVQGIEPK